MGIHLEAYCLRNSLRHSLNLVLGFKFPLRRLNPKASGQDKNYRPLSLPLPPPWANWPAPSCSLLGKAYAPLLTLPLYTLLPIQIRQSVAQGRKNQVPNQVCNMGSKEKHNCKAGPVPIPKVAFSLPESINTSAAHFCSSELVLIGLQSPWQSKAAMFSFQPLSDTPLKHPNKSSNSKPVMLSL